MDDNTDSAETLAMLLGTWGYDVRTEHDGPAGLATAAAFKPEVALLDIGLPGLSGYDVAERLAAQEDAPYLVAMTGYGQAEDFQRSRDAGYAEHLVKPVEPDRLRALLASVPPRG